MLLDNNYTLYYFIPWPQCQDLLVLDRERDHWTWADSEFAAGCFVDKEWFDKIIKKVK